MSRPDLKAIKARCEATLSGCDCCELLTKDLPDCIAEIKRLRALKEPTVKHTITPFCTHCQKKWKTLSVDDKDSYAAILPEIREHVSACKKNPMVAEIERLRELVKSAHREGFAAIEGFAKYDADGELWKLSKAKQALEDE